MNYRRKFLLSLAVLMALVTAQLAGISRGYWCQCAGGMSPAASAVCEPRECHPDLSHTACCQQDAGTKNQDDRAPCSSGGAPEHAHKFLTQEQDYRTFAPASLAAPLFTILSFAGLPPVTWLEDIPVTGQNIPRLRDGWRSPPPMAVTVLRTTVLLV